MVSKIILGTVQMGLSYGINNLNGKIPVEECFKILNYSYDNGIETLDTAEAYGTSHEVIGAFHANNPKKKFKIITKIPKEQNCNVSLKVEGYLKQLNVDYLDTIMFHAFETYMLNPKIIADLHDLKKQGLVRNIGVSVYSNSEINKLVDDEAVNVIQLPYNVFDNLSKRGSAIRLAKQNGKEIHTRSAFLQGLFFKDRSSGNRVVQELRPYLLDLDMISNLSNKSVQELTLGYCIQQPLVDRVLIGVETLEQLKLNLKASEIILDEGIIGRLDAFKINNENLLNPSLWQ